MIDQNKLLIEKSIEGTERLEVEQFFFFRPESGVVTSATHCLELDAMLIAEHAGASYARGQARPGLDYFDGSVVKPRILPPIELDGSILRNVPFPSTLTVGDTDYSVHEPVVELDLGNGRTTVAMLSEPYLYWEITIEN